MSFLQVPGVVQATPWFPGTVNRPAVPLDPLAGTHSAAERFCSERQTERQTAVRTCVGHEIRNAYWYRVAGTGNIIPESMHSSSQSARKVYVEDGKELAIPRSRSRLPATAVAPAALATVAPIHPVAAAAAEPASSEPATSGPAAAAAAALAGGEALVGRSSRELSIGSLSQESDLWSVTQDGSHVD